MEIITGGITAPQGFRAAGAACGIKKRKKDVALVVSDTPCTVAGAFTTNLVKAAPVLWDKKIVDTGAPVRALVVNSGNANACTGDKGYEDTRSTAAFMAHVLSQYASGFSRGNSGLLYRSHRCSSSYGESVSGHRGCCGPSRE